MTTQSKKKNSVSSKTAMQERRAEMARQREQQQRLILFIGAVALLAVVVIGIVLASRPATITLPDDIGTINTRYDGITAGTAANPPMSSLAAYPAPFPALGDPNAPAKIEEIASFSCPYCLQYHDTTFSKILDEIKAGRAQFIYIFTTKTGDYTPAGVTLVTSAAVCALQQGKFWQMHDILFDWQSRYGETGAANQKNIDAAAGQLGMDVGKLDACMTSPDTTKYINNSNDYADRRGLVGTPSVFLFANGQQVKPPQQNPQETMGSVAGIAIGDLRGLIEAAAKKNT